MRSQYVLAIVVLCVLAWASPAFAYFETSSQPAAQEWATAIGATFGCSTCHSPGSMGSSYGPHRGYTSSTHACDTCHSVHEPIGALKLLPGDTVKASCEVCHDGTGGRGVYGTIAARGVVVGADHSVEATNVVPGGSASTGGSATMTFRGGSGTLTCSDCHTPHGNSAVAAYLGERQRDGRAIGLLPVPVSNRLLKQRPGGVSTPVSEYGSDWCLACHAGRASGLGTVMNHPVESAITKPVEAERYNYRQLAIIGVGPYPTATTVLGPMGIDTDDGAAPQYNRAYLMPFPRVGAQVGHLPICQQCHEDKRNVGALSADGTQASPSLASITPTIVGGPAGDGLNPADNPRFQNFPHETEGYRLLVEATTTSANDDLCLNCHPPVGLP